MKSYLYPKNVCATVSTASRYLSVSVRWFCLIALISIEMWSFAKAQEVTGNREREVPTQARERAAIERERRAQLLQANPDDYFDPVRFANGNDAAYKANVERHFQIATWANSTKKRDPAFRRIMRILLENGYGIDDYSRVVQLVAYAHQDIASLRSAYQRLGIHSQAEVEELLNKTGMQKDFEARLALVKQTFVKQGITDALVLDALLSTGVGEVRNGDGSIPKTRFKTVWGDRLLTGADWMDAEFKAAAARYKGPARGSARDRVSAWLQKHETQMQSRRSRNKRAQ